MQSSKNNSFFLICIRFGTSKVRRLNRALKFSIPPPLLPGSARPEEARYSPATENFLVVGYSRSEYCMGVGTEEGLCFVLSVLGGMTRLLRFIRDA